MEQAEERAENVTRKAGRKQGVPKKDNNYRAHHTGLQQCHLSWREGFSFPVEPQEIELRPVGTMGMNKIQNGGRANWII